MPRKFNPAIQEAIAEMEKVAKKLGLPENIVKEAKELFSSLCQEGFVRGRPFLVVALTALYYKMRRDPSCPAITLQDFAKETPCNAKKIRRLYNKILAKEGSLPQVCTLRPTIFVRAFGKKIGFTQKTLDNATELAKEMVRKRVHLGRSPQVSAAACLYAANRLSREEKSQEEIGDECGISTHALRNVLSHPFFVEKGLTRYKESAVSGNVLQELIPKLLAKLSIDQQRIPFYQLKPSLRHSFSDELRGFYIPSDRLYRILRELEAKNVISIVPGPKCQEEKPDCRSCWYKICSGSIVQLREKSTPTQN